MLLLIILGTFVFFGALAGFSQPSLIEHGVISGMVAIVVAVGLPTFGERLGLGTFGQVHILAIVAGWVLSVVVARVVAALSRPKR